MKMSDVLDYVSMTEKSIRFIEAENKMIFIVNRKADKKDIKSAIENMFETKVLDIKTTIDQKGRKKAYVKFKEHDAAGEIAMKLGII